MKMNSEDVLNAKFIATIGQHMDKMIMFKHFLHAMPDEHKHIAAAHDPTKELLTIATTAAEIGLNYGGRDAEYSDELHAMCQQLIIECTEIRNIYARFKCQT